MTQVRKQISVTQGNGRNQRDDVALVFTLYRKNMLTQRGVAAFISLKSSKMLLRTTKVP